MRNFCFEEAESVLKELKSSKEGLSEEEAAARLARYGKNALEESKRAGVLRIFLSQFSDFMTVLLIAAAIVSGCIALFSRGSGGLTDTIIILLIIFANAAVGTVQQYRADRAIESLKKLAAGECRVVRGGKIKKIPAEELTIGDVIYVEEGDVIPADCRILSCNSLKCDESALTGESVPAEKSQKRIRGNSVSLGGTSDMLFCSCYAVSGNGTAVVTSVGMSTEMGKIASMLHGGGDKTPLEKSLQKLGKVITYCVLAITAVIFIIGVAVRQDGVLKNFMTAVALAVAAIPEGLPATVTIIMALGVQKMSRKKVIIRKLRSVETLGGCTVICTDKTGTLTQNRLKVERAWGAGGDWQSLLCECAYFCNTLKGERGSYTGDPTEKALMLYAADFLGGNAEGGDPSHGFIKSGEIPFTSERKMMSVYGRKGEKEVIYTKGAPDFLLAKCSYICTNSGITPLSDELKKAVLFQNDGMSDEGLRVLAFAFSSGGRREEELTFIGLAGLFDGLKKGVAEAVEECRGAGIRTVMITGDHARTAFSVAKRLKIASDMSEVVTGAELDRLESSTNFSPSGGVNRALEEKIAASSVFARVSPRHKNMIVRCLKSRGEVVAMTGDGVNDAPGIKSADIGIAMGMYGTDVTKNASDMIICDDNFATIVSAVREGRRISANIRKTIRFFLSTNLAEVLAIFIASTFFFRYDFLLSAQLLWLNLITDSFPVLALGSEKGGADVMKSPPSSVGGGLFSKGSVAFMLLSGGYITAVTVGVFALSLSLWGNAVATTVAFLTLSFAELFQAYNVRAENKSAFSGTFSNAALNATVAAAIALNILLVETPLSSAFSLVPAGGAQWALTFAAAFSVVPFMELVKLVCRLASRLKGRAKSVRSDVRFARRAGGKGSQNTGSRL